MILKIILDNDFNLLMSAVHPTELLVYFNTIFQYHYANKDQIINQFIHFLWNIKYIITNKLKNNNQYQTIAHLHQIIATQNNNFYNINNKLQELTNSSEKMMDQHKIIARVNILKNCKRFYKYRELEIITPASGPFYELFTNNFQHYIPLQTKKGYTQYKKTNNLESLHNFLGVIALNRRFLIPNETDSGMDEIDITVEASEFRPFRALFNPTTQSMLMSFYYFPFPRKTTWKPHWRMDKNHEKLTDFFKIQVN